MTCLLPQRCGSDGRACCHPACDFYGDRPGACDDLTHYMQAVSRLRRTLAATETRLSEAEKWANTMEHERDWERDVVHSELLGRAEVAEDRLSEYEQALRAIQRVCEEEYSAVDAATKAADLARAALSGSAGPDEPKADTGDAA